MDSPRFRLSHRAVADIEEIAHYLASQSLSAADRVIDELFRTFHHLALNPESGTSLDNLRPRLRMITPSKPAAKYVVFYYLASDGVLISDVIHSARDWLGMIIREER